MVSCVVSLHSIRHQEGRLKGWGLGAGVVLRFALLCGAWSGTLGLLEHALHSVRPPLVVSPAEVSRELDLLLATGGSQDARPQRERTRGKFYHLL